VSALEIAALPLLGAGVFFFVAGSVGVVRFPDMPSRLHALTKADNLGLGLIVLALSLIAGDAWTIAKLVLVWALAIVAAGTAAQLLARSALGGDTPPDEREGAP
jgi:multicomponent Na+:H+ antiporter subunit G